MESIIRKIIVQDNASMARIIRTVMGSFGAGGPGFAINDAEVDDLFHAYERAEAVYFVFFLNEKLVGGGGIAPLEGGAPNICELKKMYFLPEARGLGFGQKLLSACLTAAADIGFQYCYLETFNTMTDAIKLYEKNGFEKLEGPLGNTGHFACDLFYLLRL
jgi:putative acetyltransferase